MRSVVVTICLSVLTGSLLEVAQVRAADAKSKQSTKAAKPKSATGKEDSAAKKKKKKPSVPDIDPAKNQEHLKGLKEPDPIKETDYTGRDHQQSLAAIQEAARKIDQVILAKLQESKQNFNEPTNDYQFVRRIYLDVAGRIPTAQEAEAFLEKKDSNRRQVLIDQLLLSEDYPCQMFNWLADMLRVTDNVAGDNSGYQAWLIDQVATNRPWDETVHDLLTAEGNLVNAPATGWLIRDRGMPLDSVSNTLTTFMGANIACAQCHDHPFADWTQRNFYELAAFFGATEVPSYSKRLLGGFSSGIENGQKQGSRDLMHLVTPTTTRVTFAPNKHLSYPEDYAYSDARPGQEVVPAFPVMKDLAPRIDTIKRSDGRKAFADWMTHKDNRQFAAAIANRLWRKAFGRAVIEPVTEMDDLSVADNPQLIKALAELMRDLNFDLMAFQRVIYNTRAYQAQASVTPQEGDAYRFPGPLLRRMTAEQAWDSLLTLTEGDKVNDSRRSRKAAAQSYDHFKPGALLGLTNMTKWDYHDLIMAAYEAQQKMSGQRGGRSKKGGQARASEMEQPAKDTHFLRQFGQSNRELADGGTTEGGIPQVLMLMNGEPQKMFDDNRLAVFKQVSDASQQDRVNLMYLSFLSRPPTATERDFIVRERIKLKELAWILINTREFIFVQ